MNSQSLKRRLSRRFPAVKKRLNVIPLGTDLDRFRPAASAGERQHLREKFGITEHFAVLYVGRVIPGKGVDILIRATASAQKQIPLQLVIAGKGPPKYVRSLRNLAQKHDVHAVFLGQMNHEQIDQLYRSVDCLVCPSQNHEAFGLVNVEAMASGIPVIASDNGGIREIIHSGINGYLISGYKKPRSLLPFYAIWLSVPILCSPWGKAAVKQHFQTSVGQGLPYTWKLCTQGSFAHEPYFLFKFSNDTANLQ